MKLGRIFGQITFQQELVKKKRKDIAEFTAGEFKKLLSKKLSIPVTLFHL